MVVRIINPGGNVVGNLYDDPLADYGVGDDTVLLLPDGLLLSITIKTGEGDDKIYTLRALPTNNATIYAGFGNDKIYCGAAMDTVYDGSGNDIARLGAGGDFAYAGTGNDTIDGGDGIDHILFRYKESDGGALVANSTAVTFDLAVTSAQNLGIFGLDTITGFEDASGGDGNDKLYGTGQANSLAGLLGNDLLDGRGGADRLFGGNGADTLIGGGGADSHFLDGNDGARDVVKYLAITDSGLTSASWDVINSFHRGAAATDDRIDLSAIDATATVAGDQAFSWRGTLGFLTSSAGEVRIAVSGADTFVYVDTDSDVSSEMIIKVVGVTGLTAADFIL